MDFRLRSAGNMELRRAHVDHDEALFEMYFGIRAETVSAEANDCCLRLHSKLA
jgi:hypothetical protein